MRLLFVWLLIRLPLSVESLKPPAQSPSEHECGRDDEQDNQRAHPRRQTKRTVHTTTIKTSPTIHTATRVCGHITCAPSVALCDSLCAVRVSPRRGAGTG